MGVEVAKRAIHTFPVVGEWKVYETPRNNQKAMTVAAQRSLAEPEGLYRTAALDRRVELTATSPGPNLP